MNTKIQENLKEAYRRYTVHGGNAWSLDKIKFAWVGLETPSQMKSTINAGLMSPVKPETPRILNWYRLTEKGALIILKWYEDGFKINRDGTGDIPYYEDTLEKISC